MNDNIVDLCVDATPYYMPSTEPTSFTSQCLDTISAKLNMDDYRSVFFLLMDSIGPRNFLYFVKKDRDYLKRQFKKYYKFDSKEAMLIEIFGTMQRYDLLKIIGTCQHVYEKDKDTMNQISQFWKCLFKICEQLTEEDVRYFGDKIFPGLSINVTCAEELLCQAFVGNIFNENGLEKLKEIFKDRLECSRIISSYTNSSKLSYYPIRRPTRNSPCGRAVIFNHENFWPESNDPLHLPVRKGSDKDADALKKMWESFGFIASIYTDCTDDEVMNVFQKESSEVDHSSFEAFVVCYLSHGDEGIVYSSNKVPIKLVDLMDIMANKCPTLINKPKLFFIQACAGRQVQQGVGISPSTLPPIPGITGLGSNSSINTPLYSDILMVYSSFPGFVSYRVPDGQSWFISDLVQIMNKYGDEITILNVVTKVTHAVAKKTGGVTNFTNCKQTPICSNTLKYELKLKKLLEHSNLQGNIQL